MNFTEKNSGENDVKIHVDVNVHLNVKFYFFCKILIKALSQSLKTSEEPRINENYEKPESTVNTLILIN
jgi:hypothetical protein